MTVDPRAPCIIGVAQAVRRPEQGPSPEPLELWEDVCRRAAADAKAATDVLNAVESLQIVYCQSWQYDEPPARLCARLGIEPRHTRYSGIGGTTPQVLLNDAAESIARGEVDVGIVCGAEALDTVRRLRKGGKKPQWSFKPNEKRPFPFEAPFHPAEVAHEVFQAYTTFALWDVARRAHLGVAPDDYRAQLGALFAPMTEIAARNPFAWFPVARSAEELATPTPSNRMVAYPYTKYLISVMDVDLSAALVVASHEAADRLGVPADRRVYLRGWCYATDPVYVAEHEPTWASPAMRAASAEAMRCAGIGIDDVAHLDLYSCFPSSVLFALDALGLTPDDRRAPFTVTGGLPFFGGAGSDYVTHSIATMVERLRDDPGALGMCSGVGMHMTKHVYGVYSTEPGEVRMPERACVQADLDERDVKSITDRTTGPATVATYTVLHGRDETAVSGLLVCDLPDGTRAYAKVLDAAFLASLEHDEWVGRTVTLIEGEGFNLAVAE